MYHGYRGREITMFFSMKSYSNYLFYNRVWYYRAEGKKGKITFLWQSPSQNSGNEHEFDTIDNPVVSLCYKIGLKTHISAIEHFTISSYRGKLHGFCVL